MAEASKDPLILGSAEPSPAPVVILSQAAHVLEPVPIAEEGPRHEAVMMTAEAVLPAELAKESGGGLSRVLLILFVIGIVAFVAGVLLAAAVLLGVLDLQTGWVKDLLKTAKDVVKHFSPGGG